jgi:thimet oligopeptidase
MIRARSLFILALLAASCAGEAPTARGPHTPSTAYAPTTPPPAGGAPTPKAALDIDPTLEVLGPRGASFGKARVVEGVARVCDESMATALGLIGEVSALPADAPLDWNAVMGKLDRARVALRNAGDFPALMAVAHPVDDVRIRAKECEPKLDKLETGMYLDKKLADVVKRYAATKPALSPERARLLEHWLRDFRRNGLELDEAGQTRLRAINEEATKLALEFDSNIADSSMSLKATPAELAGLPDAWIAGHKPGADGKITVTTDYPDYFPVLQYAKDRKVALELYKKFENRAADTNIAILDRILALRHEKAKLLGYDSWADYMLEPRMAKDAKTVAAFLESLRVHLKDKGAREMKALRGAHVKLGGKATDAIPPSDRVYLEDQIRNTKYGVDSKEVSQYFEVSRVKQGLLDITAKMFGLSYRRSASMPTWHADVEPIEVLDAKGKLVGRFYFDLFPREGKFKHAAVFSIRDTVKLPDGRRLVPIAAIECNFPKPAPGAPALMSHSDVVTFFHEFGHVLHHVLSEAELSAFAGTSVARDFVESPSQMLEEWAWAKDTLALFAVHHETHKPLPDKLHAAMLKSRAFGRALSTQRQLYLAALDQAYHTRPPGMDTTKVLQEIHDAYTPFKFVEGTHFQASFGHLMGYDAGYYGYQWALSIARDLYTRFAKDGMLDRKTADAYRATILARGASEDEAKMVERFLGRPPSDAAYKAFLVAE